MATAQSGESASTPAAGAPERKPRRERTPGIERRTPAERAAASVATTAPAAPKPNFFRRIAKMFRSH